MLLAPSTTLPEVRPHTARLLLTLILLASLSFFVALGRQAITDSDEAFYAEASREMVESGDWLTPHFNYRVRFEKPVLYYWLTAGMYLLAGPAEWAARFWSALSGLGLTLLTWRAGRRMLADHEAAWLAGAMTATCAGYFAIARTALPDLPLAWCITLTIWSTLRALDEAPASASTSWWASAGLGAGLGFLMKGPIALVVPAIVIAPIWWIEGRRPVAWRGLLLAAAIFAVVGLPWYAAMTAEHGRAYLDSFFVADNLERFATDRFNEPRPLWFYGPVVLGGMLPWSAYLMSLPSGAILDLVRRRRSISGPELRLLIWAAAPLLFFTASVGKQPRYILPVLPPLAMLLARSIVHHVRARSSDGGARRLALATWATAAMFALLGLLLVRARPVFVGASPEIAWSAAAVIAAAAFALAWIAATRRWTRLPQMLIVCSLSLLLAAHFAFGIGTRPAAVERIADLVTANRVGSEPVGVYEVFVRNLVFYTRSAHVPLPDEQAAIAFVRSPERVLLVVSQNDLRRLESLAGVRMRSLGRVEYMNTANIRVRTILRPDPARDVETVVLATNR